MKRKLKLSLFTAVLLFMILLFFVTRLNGGVPEPKDTGNDEYISYTFRSERLLSEHYEKHGIYMGFSSEEDYEKAASDVANDPDSLHKLEKEDGDDVYYKEETNEFVVISKDGYIRTYFCPDSGKKYFDKQ